MKIVKRQLILLVYKQRIVLNIQKRQEVQKFRSHKNNKSFTIGMSTSITAISSLFFIYSIQSKQLTNLHALIFAINIAYFYKYCQHNNFNSEQVFKYVLHGQTLYSLIYLFWLNIFVKHTYVFYVPIFLSVVAKLTWLFTSKDKLNLQFLEESALFQTKTEIFIIGYQFLSLPYGGWKTLLQLILLILLLKFKYSFHDKAQQAFKQLHFVLDKKLRRTNIRPKYQKIVQILGLIGQIYGGSKQIIY